MKLTLFAGLLLGLLSTPNIVGANRPGAQDGSHPEFKLVHIRPFGLKGPDYYQIIADFGNDDQFPMLDVRARTKAMSIEDRAQAIAKRLKKLQASNPEWYKTLKVGKAANGEKIVAPGGIPEVPYIITADQSSIGPWECENSDDLAQKLIAMLTNPFHLEDRAGSTAEKVRGVTTAESLMMEGDRLTENDPAQAKLRYQQALKMRPDYPYVQLQLARIYLDEGERRKASEMVTAAQQHPKLAPELQAIIERLKANLK